MGTLAHGNDCCTQQQSAHQPSGYAGMLSGCIGPARCSHNDTSPQSAVRTGELPFQHMHRRCGSTPRRHWQPPAKQKGASRFLKRQAGQGQLTSTRIVSASDSGTTPAAAASAAAAAARSSTVPKAGPELPGITRESPPPATDDVSRLRPVEISSEEVLQTSERAGADLISEAGRQLTEACTPWRLAQDAAAQRSGPVEGMYT